METYTPSSTRKRLRLNEGIPFNSPIHSPDHVAAVAPSTDIVAEFAARAGRVQALQKDLKHVTQQAQQQGESLLQVKSELSSLMAENSRLAALSRAEVNQAQHARSRAESQLQTEIRRVAELESKLAASKSALQRSTAKANESDDGLQQQQNSVSSEDRSFSEVQRLKKALQEQEMGATDTAERLRRDKQLADDTASASEAHARELQEHLDKALEHSAEAEKAAAAAQQDAAAARHEAATAAARHASNAGSASATSELANVRAELSHMEKEVIEARKMRHYVTNAELLREKLRAVETRAERAEASLQEAAASQPSTSGVKHELEKWTTFYQGVADVKTPEDILHKLQGLQKDAVLLGDRLAQATATVESQQGRLAQADEQMHEQQEAASEADKALEEAVACAARMEGRLKLLEQERDGLKRIVKSYQQDSSGAAAAEHDVLAVARTQTLEQTVETLQQQTAEIEASLTTKIAESIALRAVTSAAEARANAAEADASQLGNQIAGMQKRLGRGEFNSETTRVLHWVRNPAAEQQRADAAARIAELELESDALRSQLQQLESLQQHRQQCQDGQTATSAPGVEAAMADTEIAISKRKIADLEKSVKRLKEVFNIHITSFREACYFLFGYNIEMAAKATSTAHSAIASTTFTLVASGGDASTQLRFVSKPNNSGLRLLPTPYTESLKQEVETYIGRFCSIPAFLANLTMENFQRNTQH